MVLSSQEDCQELSSNSLSNCEGMLGEVSVIIRCTSNGRFAVDREFDDIMRPPALSPTCWPPLPHFPVPPLPSSSSPPSPPNSPLGCRWDALELPWNALGLLWGALGLPWGVVGRLLGVLGVPLGSLGVPLGVFWAPLGSPWASLGCRWASFGRPWVTLGSPGRLGKKMWLKYRACAQDLASGNLHGWPGGPAGPAGPAFMVS
jgi:hypothetical protein